MRCGLGWLLVLLTYTLVLLAVTALPAGDPTLSRVREKRQLSDQGITSDLSRRLGEAAARELLQNLMAKQGKRNKKALGDQTFTSDLAKHLSENAARELIQDLMAQAVGERVGPASKRQLGDQGFTSDLSERLRQMAARERIKDLMAQAIGKRSGWGARRSTSEVPTSRMRRAVEGEQFVGREDAEARKVLVPVPPKFRETRSMTEGDMYNQPQKSRRRDPMADFLDRLYEQQDF